MKYDDKAWEDHKLVELYRRVGWTPNRIHTLQWIVNLRPAIMLEIGCLDGCNIRKLRELGYNGKYVGLDITQAHLKEATLLSPSETFVKGDVRNLTFSNRSFALVLFSDVIQHLQEPTKAMTEVFRVADKYMLLSTYGSTDKTFTTHNAKFFNWWYSRGDILTHCPNDWKLIEFATLPHPTAPQRKIFHFQFHRIDKTNDKSS